MRYFLFTVLFFFNINLFSQSGTDSVEAVKKIIEIFFEGFKKGDTVMIRSVMDPTMRLQTVDDRKRTVVLLNEDVNGFIKIIGSPRKQVWTEKITSYDIKIDGFFANAWCGYEFYVDTTFSHAGVDNIQLYKKNGKWLIFAITDTRRKQKDVVFSVDEHRKKINTLLDNWHKSAATADEKIFFGSMDEDARYLGTDKTENWTKKDFESWSKKYFDKDKAWDFKPHTRNIYFTDDMQYAWFDELLDTWMGVCRGSGVLKYENGSWKIMHYNLAITIPNEKMNKVKKLNK